MAFPPLTQLQRRRRQLDTLRKKLEAADELLGLILHIANDRELDQAEQDEKASTETKRQYIANAITETERLLSSK